MDGKPQSKAVMDCVEAPPGFVGRKQITLFVGAAKYTHCPIMLLAAWQPCIARMRSSVSPTFEKTTAPLALNVKGSPALKSNPDS